MANFLSDALEIGDTTNYDKAKERKHDQVESLQFSKHEGTESEPKSFTNIPYDKIGVIDSYIDEKESMNRIPGSLSIEDYDKKYDEIDSVKKLNRVEGKESEPSTLLLKKLQSIDEFYSNANKNTPEKKAAFIKSVEEFYKDKTNVKIVPAPVTKTISDFYDKNVGKLVEALPYDYAIALNKQMQDIMMTINTNVDYDEKKLYDEIAAKYNSMMSELINAGVLSPEAVEKFKLGNGDTRNEDLALIHKYVNALHEFTKTISETVGDFNNLQNDGKQTLGPDFTKYPDADKKLAFNTMDLDKYPDATQKLNAPTMDISKYPDGTIKTDGSSKNNDSSALNKFADIDNVSGKPNTHGEVSDSLPVYDATTKAENIPITGPQDKPYNGNNESFNPISKDTNEATFLKKVADINTNKGLKEDRAEYDKSAVQVDRNFINENINVLSQEIASIKNSIGSDNGVTPFQAFIDMYMNYYIGAEVAKLDKSLNGEHFNQNKDNYKGDIESLEFHANDPSKFEKNFWYYYSQFNTMNAVALISSTTDNLLGALGLDGTWVNGKNVSNALNTAKQMGIVPDNMRKAEQYVENAAFIADIVAKLYQYKDKLTFENLTFAATYMYFETPLLPHFDVHKPESKRDIKVGFTEWSDDYEILGYEVKTGFLNGLEKYGKNAVSSVTSLFDYNPFANPKTAAEDKDYGAEHFISKLYDKYYTDDKANNYVPPFLYFRADSDNTTANNNENKNDLSGKSRTPYYFEKDNSFGAETVGGKDTFNYLKELEISELSNDLMFKGRKSIKDYTLFDQFKWDLKLERIKGVTNGDSELNSQSSKYAVPLLSDFMPNKAEWLPVSDFNINFSDMDMATIPLFQGMNLPMPEKISYPLTGSMTFVEDASLSVTSWLHAYKRTIFAGTGGYLTMPYQRCSLRLSIYFWEWVQSAENLKVFHSMLPNTMATKGNEFIKKYVLYILPTNIPDNIVGSSTPNPLSITMNFSVVGAESGFMVDLNDAKRLYEAEKKTRGIGTGDEVKAKLKMSEASHENINASLYKTRDMDSDINNENLNKAQLTTAGFDTNLMNATSGSTSMPTNSFGIK